MPTKSFATTPTGQALPFHRIFEAQSGLAALLSPDLTVVAVSDIYLREALLRREDLMGASIFDVFPDNPELPESSPSGNLRNALQQVLETRKPQVMEVMQYDIPDPERPGRFLERYWTSTNTPILDADGEIAFILHEPVNVTLSQKARLQLQESRQREQEALAKAEQQRLRLERLFGQAPAALAMLEGPDLVFRVINESYQQLFPGRTLMDVPLFEALPELKGQPIERIARNVIETGETFEGKEVLIPLARYAGQAPEDIYWNFIYQALHDAGGRITGMLIFALDVTTFVQTRRQVEQTAAELQALNQSLESRVERRTLERAVAQAEAERQKKRLEKLFMNAPAAICILDGPNLVYELVNPAYQQLFPGRQLLGKPLLEALPEIKHNQAYRTFRQVYETGITHEEKELLIPIARPDSGQLEDRYFRFVQQARTNEQGQPDGILVFALEVTDQVLSRRAAEASAKQLRLVTDALPVLIGYLDKEERYRFTNKAYEAWFPVKAEELLGRKVRDVVGEAAYSNVKHYIDRALAGEALDFEAKMPYQPGFVKHIRTSYVPDVQNGEVAGFYTLVTDITEQAESHNAVEQSAREAKLLAEEVVKANEELRLANQQLVHINTDLDNFIYTASHDLRAPISNIEMLMRELLHELPGEEHRPEIVTSITRMMQGAIDRFKRTIDNLTEITKLQKQHNSKAKRLNIEKLVEEIKLDLEPLIKEADAQLVTEIKGKVTVSFAEKNMRSIVYNLLSNAIKYRHPKRRPHITISCYKSGGELVLAVQDNGLGLKPLQQDKLFSMFRRFHNHVEGSGVGLYMVKRIVDNAGGRIVVQSQAGEGTTFTVYLQAES